MPVKFDDKIRQYELRAVLIIDAILMVAALRRVPCAALHKLLKHARYVVYHWVCGTRSPAINSHSTFYHIDKRN